MLTRNGSYFLLLLLFSFIFVDKSNLGELTGALYHCYQSVLPLFCCFQFYFIFKLGYSNNYMQQVYGWSQGMGGGGGGQLVFFSLQIQLK